MVVEVENLGIIKADKDILNRIVSAFYNQYQRFEKRDSTILAEEAHQRAHALHMAIEAGDQGQDIPEIDEPIKMNIKYLGTIEADERTFENIALGFNSEFYKYQEEGKALQTHESCHIYHAIRRGLYIHANWRRAQEKYCKEMMNLL